MHQARDCRLLARLLREEAARPDIPADRVERVLRLAKFFEKLAIEPDTDIADPRFTHVEPRAGKSNRVA